MKKIGVLTSGGDAPGMNAAIRAVTRTALYKNMEVIGIRRGYNGLINGDVFEMNARSVSSIIQRGGTHLAVGVFGAQGGHMGQRHHILRNRQAVHACIITHCPAIAR